MNKDSKRINSNFRGQIGVLKNRMRHATTPFDGTGYPFKQALKEVRNEGIDIIYNKVKCHYYNPKTIAEIWGYN